MTTWTPSAPPAGAWTSETPAPRPFDPYGFDRAPRFDTGSPAGIWAAFAKPTQTWTAEA